VEARLIASFTIDCIPVAKGRPRISTRGGFARAYTPAKTRTFEAMIAERARAAVGPLDPYKGAVELEAHFALPVPKSWSKRDRTDALAGVIQPQGKPDLDNFTKALSDALNGIVYADDSQIVSARITKRYGEEPGAAVTVRAA
jgi:Holliday junction resolvase RusA-like endonuclease